MLIDDGKGRRLSIKEGKLAEGCDKPTVMKTAGECSNLPDGAVEALPAAVLLLLPLPPPASVAATLRQHEERNQNAQTAREV